jgi:hypothetical protein
MSPFWDPLTRVDYQPPLTRSYNIGVRALKGELPQPAIKVRIVFPHFRLVDMAMPDIDWAGLPFQHSGPVRAELEG